MLRFVIVLLIVWIACSAGEKERPMKYTGQVKPKTECGEWNADRTTTLGNFQAFR